MLATTAPRGYSADAIEARLKKVHNRRSDAEAALDAFRGLEAARLRALLSCPDDQAVDAKSYEPLRWEDPTRATLAIATMPLDARERTAFFRRGKRDVAYIAGANDDRACEDANIRAQLVGTERLEAYEKQHADERGRPLYHGLGFVSRRGDEEWGRTEGWGVLLEQAREVSQSILLGALSAIQRQCPDQSTSERWAQAGVTVLHDLAKPWGAFERYGSTGVPPRGGRLEERFPRRRRPRPEATVARPGSIAWFTP